MVEYSFLVSLTMLLSLSSVLMNARCNCCESTHPPGELLKSSEEAIIHHFCSRTYRSDSPDSTFVSACSAVPCSSFAYPHPYSQTDADAYSFANPDKHPCADVVTDAGPLPDSRGRWYIFRWRFLDTFGLSLLWLGQFARRCAEKHC